jgi:hypothetical protein
MALYLEGKTPLSANDLSLKEATAMSRDIKYIGMDVHKEAVVIAVLAVATPWFSLTCPFRSRRKIRASDRSDHLALPHCRH